MFELNDYKLERANDVPVPVTPESSSHSLMWGTVVVAVIVAAGAGLWYFTSLKQPVTSAVTAPAAPAAAVPEQVETPLVRAADIELPPLPQSDPLVRELVAGLSSHPTIAAWLATKGLIANFTVATLNVAEGRTPARFLRPIAPRGRFRTSRAGEDLVVDPRSYERYTPHADAIAALDSVGTASLYLTLKPRITDAYRELGYPEGDFDRVLERAIGVLLKAPASDVNAAVQPNGVTYAYSDATLESLSPAQKQLLRMGPRNGEIIRGKLAEIAQLLKLRPEGLP